MNEIDIGASGSPLPPERSQTQWIITAIGGLAALVLVIGLIVLLGNGNDEIATSSTVASIAQATPTEPVATTSSTTTSVPPTITLTTTSVPPTTATSPTTAPPSTTITSLPPTTTVPEPPPTTASPGPSGDTWTITSQFFPDDPFTLRRVAQAERLSVYDGAIDVAPSGVRCVALVIEGSDGWSEWCGDAGQAVSFVVLDGIDPWLVEVAADPGTIALTRRQPSWALPSNGCTAPMTTLIAAQSPEPAVTTGIVCVPGEAFVSNSAVFLQTGPPDGGGALVTEGDEGWDSAGRGTSIDCDGWPDGVDRCALYGVEFELFEALLPIPPDAALTDTTDIVAMGDETATAIGWIGAAEMDSAALDALIVDELTDREPEAAPNITRASGIGYGAGLDLLVVEVPAMDDSILSTTWAAWISTSSPATVVKMLAWETCARGLDVASGLCV